MKQSTTFTRTAIVSYYEDIVGPGNVHLNSDLEAEEILNNILRVLELRNSIEISLIHYSEYNENVSVLFSSRKDQQEHSIESVNALRKALPDPPKTYSCIDIIDSIETEWKHSDMEEKVFYIGCTNRSEHDLRIKYNHSGTLMYFRTKTIGDSKTVIDFFKNRGCRVVVDDEARNIFLYTTGKPKGRAPLAWIASLLLPFLLG